MKKTLLSIAVAIAVLNASAQVCTPNPLYADSLFGIWPDTTDNLAGGMVGVAYFQDINIIVPQDAGLIDAQFAGIMLDSVQLTGLTGLPPGLTYGCASQTGGACSYLTGVLGCAVINGTPTTAGTYPLTIDVTAYTTFFGSPVPVPQSFSGYHIIIAENTLGLGELSAGLGGVSNVPNPFSANTTINFSLVRAGETRIRIYSLLGDEIYSTKVQGRTGQNKFLFEAADKQEGVYLYKIESGREMFTGRMMLAR